MLKFAQTINTYQIKVTHRHIIKKDALAIFCRVLRETISEKNKTKNNYENWKKYSHFLM